jgi:hypothetical protein
MPSLRVMGAPLQEQKNGRVLPYQEARTNTGGADAQRVPQIAF